MRSRLLNACGSSILASRASSPSPSAFKKVLVSGIQPTGPFHIGNYLGLIQNWVELQKEEGCEKYLSIADLHSITVGFSPTTQMRRNILETAAGLIAGGVDPESCVFFQQSEIPEHTELAWILSGLQPSSSLQTMAQYKDKSSQFKRGTAPMGLLCYPLLQAADVLLYKGTHVPVGEDQTQHMEMLRHLAKVFNAQFKAQYFPIPEKVISNFPRVKSLRNPMKKMSKSDPSEFSRIDVSDSEEMVLSKCRRALSDFQSHISFDLVNRPAISNLVLLHSYFSKKSPEEVVEMSKEMNTAQFKESLFHAIERTLAPIRDRYQKLLQREGHLREVIQSGNHKARIVARENLQEVKRLVGFL